mmetsp:Transcript_26332/g.81351  ORF Transcript_26332/g.81351 Transcript_26332/m.81351 type:complete len:314 (-) Transcript_26332:50-991(-)
MVPSPTAPRDRFGDAVLPVSVSLPPPADAKDPPGDGGSRFRLVSAPSESSDTWPGTHVTSTRAGASVRLGSPNASFAASTQRREKRLCTSSRSTCCTACRSAASSMAAALAVCSASRKALIDSTSTPLRVTVGRLSRNPADSVEFARAGLSAKLRASNTDAPRMNGCSSANRIRTEFGTTDESSGADGGVLLSLPAGADDVVVLVPTTSVRSRSRRRAARKSSADAVASATVTVVHSSSIESVDWLAAFPSLSAPGHSVAAETASATTSDSPAEDAAWPILAGARTQIAVPGSIQIQNRGIVITANSVEVCLL